MQKERQGEHVVLYPRSKVDPKAQFEVLCICKMVTSGAIHLYLFQSPDGRRSAMLRVSAALLAPTLQCQTLFLFINPSPAHEGCLLNPPLWDLYYTSQSGLLIRPPNVGCLSNLPMWLFPTCCKCWHVRCANRYALNCSSGDACLCNTTFTT